MIEIIKNKNKVLDAFEYIKNKSNDTNLVFYLSELTEYMKNVLEYEEKLLTKENYPDINNEHQKSHSKIVKNMIRLRQGIESEYFKFDLDLLDVVKNIYKEHTEKNDEKYMPYLRIKQFCDKKEKELNGNY